MRSGLTPIFLLSLCLLRSPGVMAAPSAPLPAPDGQRFLFVVDVSAGMEKLAAENESTLYDLIFTGLYGQMRTGDTYGLWTFNKETHAGQFPMQVWDMRRHNQIATIAAAFLGERTYEKSGDTAQMIKNLTRVIQAVSNLNVFIISDGREAMRGTPFDKGINAEYKRQRKERSQARRPFITTLVARDGVIGNFSVTIAGQPILLPERPAPVVAAGKPAPPPALKGTVTSNTPVETAGSNAIVRAKQPEPPAPAPAPSAAPEKTGPPVNAIAQAEKPAAPGKDIANAGPPASPAHRQIAIETITRANDATSSPTTVSPPDRNETTTPVTSAQTGATAPPASGEPPVSHGVLEAFFPDAIPVAARELPAAPPEPELPVRPTTPAVQAAAMPVHPASSGGLYLAFGGLLAAAALFLLFVVMRRPRPAPGGSLITQSMERR